MPDFQQLDVTVANRFISSLSKSLQALCHGCMDFDTGIEIVGYINVSIDCGRKVDYVLNERVLKSNTNSMTFVSNSFLAKKEQTKQTRDGACSPVPELSTLPATPPSYSGRFRSSYPSHAGTSSFSQSYVLRGSQKRGMEREWRTPKRLRGGRLQYSSPQETASSGQTSYSPLTDDNSFKMPQSQTVGNLGEESQINIKQEVMENETEKSEFPTDQGDNIEQTDEYKSNTDSLSASDIKKDPDSSAMPADETNISEDTNNESDADFKGTFLQPSTSDQPDEADKLISTVTKLSGETSEINKPSSSNRINDVTDDTYADNIASCSEMHLDYEEGDEGNYPQSVHSDAGEGSSDAGQFEVIEIDDEDEDVQAMFAESRVYDTGSQRKYLPKYHRLKSTQHLPHVFTHHASTEETSFREEKGNNPENSIDFCAICNCNLPSSVSYQCHYSEVHASESYVSPFDATGRKASVSSQDHHLQNRYGGNRHEYSFEPLQGNAYGSTQFSNMDSFKTSETFVQCSFCDCKLDTRAMYQKHMNECHREKNALPFSCSMCQKGFFSLTGLRHHIEAHNGRQFVCAICDARFQHKHNLKRHVLGVHKLKECPNCLTTFPAGPEFNSHLLTCGSDGMFLK
ncbi:hypothetical protein Btru_056296 [Bulinus truncatus]|nr:hypothetical protein Btru_056296 [Bulinus truncatus]